MQQREASLPSWESMREPSEASAVDEDEDEEDEEDEIRSTPAPGLRMLRNEGASSNHATVGGGSSSSASAMKTSTPSGSMGGIRPIQKRKESEGRANDLDQAAKRARHESTLATAVRKPGLGGFQSGKFGGSSTNGNRTMHGAFHRKSASSSQENPQTSNSSAKTIMPPPSLPSHSFQAQSFGPSSSNIQPSVASAHLHNTGPQQMDDIPSSLVPELFASAIEKKKKVEEARAAAGPSRSNVSSTSAPLSSNSSFKLSSVTPSPTKVKPKSSEDIIDLCSSDSDHDLPDPPPRRVTTQGKPKDKTKQKASRSSQSLSSSTSLASMASPVGKPKPAPLKQTKSKPNAPLSTPEVIELTDSSDDEKRKKSPSTKTIVASNKSGVGSRSNKTYDAVVSRKDDDKMDVDPPASKTSMPSSGPFTARASRPVVKTAPTREQLEPMPTLPMTDTPSTVETNPFVQPSTASSSSSASSTYSRPPVLSTPTKTSTPADASDLISNNQPKMTFDFTRPLASAASPSTSTATNASTSTFTRVPTTSTSPHKHKHKQVAHKVSGTGKTFKSKLPMQPRSIRSPSSSSSSSSTSKPIASTLPDSPVGHGGSDGQIDMRDLNTALGLPSPSRTNEKGKGKARDVTPPSVGVKDLSGSPSLLRSPNKTVGGKSSPGQQQKLSKFVARAPIKRLSLTGAGSTVDVPIDLTSDPEDVEPTVRAAEAAKIPATTASSRCSTDELAIHPPLYVSSSPNAERSSLPSLSSPPPDSALEDPPSSASPAPTPLSQVPQLKDIRRQSAPTLGEPSGSITNTGKGKQRANNLGLLAHSNAALAQSVPTSPTQPHLVALSSTFSQAKPAGATTFVTGPVCASDIAGAAQDEMDNTDPFSQHRRSLSGVEADEVQQTLVDDLGNISMEEPQAAETDMTVDSDSDSEALPDSQVTLKPMRRKRIMSPVSDEAESTASGPSASTSTRSSRRSSRLSKVSSGTGSPSSAGTHSNVFDVPGMRQSPSSSRGTSPEISAPRITAGTLGGFPAFQFKTYRHDPKYFPKVYHNSDLTTDLHDHMNSQKEPMTTLPDLRAVYEAMILQNTAEDEPNAPPITIHNNIDDEPTPPWNFYYTNKMWHGEGVPEPDIKNLKGCGCKGKCNPKSKTCECAIRNAGYFPHQTTGYDISGKLLSEGPVHECNVMCGCDEDCYNRVVQQGRKYPLSIRKTPNKGWGVFNGPMHMPAFSFIGIYSGEILTDKEANDRGRVYNRSGITYLFNLDFYHAKEIRKSEINLYVVDAFHAGNFTRYLNHSCEPNCRLYPIYTNEADIQKPLLVVFSLCDIRPNEEICFDYSGNYGDEEEEKGEEDQSEDEGDTVYKTCQCGAPTCKGKKIFK